MLPNLKSAFAAILALGLAATLAAQPNKDLPTESVEVTKEFDARLLETNKVVVTPLLPALDTTTKRQAYDVSPKPLAIKYDAPKLRPIGQKTTGKEKIYNGYLKAGLGLPTSFLGELGYYFGQKGKYDAKLWARHHSANYTSNENQRFAKNNLLGSANFYLTKNTAVEAKVGWAQHVVHYYGYDHAKLMLAEEAIRQSFSMPEISARLYNSERTAADLNYYIQPTFYSLSDNYSNLENGFNLSMGATKWFAEKHAFRMNVRTDFTSFEDTAAQSLNNIYLQPSFTFHSDILNLKVGGNFASNRDQWSVFPDAELAVRVWGDNFQIFGGASGDLRKNTYRTLSEYNPFIQIRGSKLQNTRYDNYYGGIKGNLGWLDYVGQVTYGNAKNLALFQPVYDTLGPTRFHVLYDTAKIFNLQGTVKIIPIKDLTLTATISQTVFSFDNDAKHAWGLPNSEINLSGKYLLLGGKANVHADCYIADEIRYLNREGISQTDGGLVDFSLGGGYNFMENVGMFLDINNLFNNKRQRWHDYPIYGLNVMLGVHAKF